MMCKDVRTETFRCKVAADAHPARKTVWIQGKPVAITLDEHIVMTRKRNAWAGRVELGAKGLNQDILPAGEAVDPAGLRSPRGGHRRAATTTAVAGR